MERADGAVLLDFRALYDYGAEQTDAMLGQLEAAGEDAASRRPAPDALSAEEQARKLLWLEDALLRVENLGLEPYPFPPGFPVLPGQRLEKHFGLALLRQVREGLGREVREALDEMTPELLSDTIEDSGGRTVERNLARYLDLASAARAEARMALSLAVDT